jgi:hypothetical protein
MTQQQQEERPIWPSVASTGMEVAPVMPDSLNPKNLQEAMDLSKIIAVSDFVPDDLQGKPGNVLVIMLYGMELGISVMSAMNEISTINKRPTLKASLVRAKFRERGHRIGVVCGVDVGGGRLCGELPEHAIHGVPTDRDPGMHPFVPDHTNERCTVKAIRRDTGETAVVTWTIEDALTAGLVQRVDGGKYIARSKFKPNEAKPWEKYPKAQLYARASAWAVRQLAPEVLLGLYTTEEVRDMQGDGPSKADVVEVGEPVADDVIDPDEAVRIAQAGMDEYAGGA